MIEEKIFDRVVIHFQFFSPDLDAQLIPPAKNCLRRDGDPN